MSSEGQPTTAQIILERLVSIESPSGSEGPAADALTAIVQEAGLTVERLDNNVWFSIGTGAKTLLLNSHLDIVPASEGHPYPPFEATVVDGWLYGRGAVDAKGSVASMTAAILSLHAEGWRPDGGRVLGAFTACEESGWPYNGLEVTRPHLPPVSAAIVGEPTDLEPCVAQKGKSAHAARPHLGDNAVVKASRDVVTLSEFQPDRVHPELGMVTVTPTVMNGGTARNVIPDLCSVHVDVRSTPAYTHDELVALIRAQVESDVAIHSDRLIPVDTRPEEDIVRAAVAASGGKPFGSPTASDWIFLSDVPTVKMGPGSSNLSHTAAERMNLAELNRAVDVYRNTILRYFDA
jgi:acetylornithine deacetylase